MSDRWSRNNCGGTRRPGFRARRQESRGPRLRPEGAEKDSYSARTGRRWARFQTRVPARISARTDLCQRSWIAFMTGAWITVVMITMWAAWNTASNDPVNCEPWSRTRYLNRSTCSSIVSSSQNPSTRDGTAETRRCAGGDACPWSRLRTGRAENSGRGRTTPEIDARQQPQSSSRSWTRSASARIPSRW